MVTNFHVGLTLLFILNRFPKPKLVSHTNNGDNLCIVKTFRINCLVEQSQSGGKSVIRQDGNGISLYIWPDYFIREEASNIG